MLASLVELERLQERCLVNGDRPFRPRPRGVDCLEILGWQRAL